MAETRPCSVVQPRVKNGGGGGGASGRWKRGHVHLVRWVVGAHLGGQLLSAMRKRSRQMEVCRNKWKEKARARSSRTCSRVSREATTIVVILVVNSPCRHRGYQPFSSQLVAVIQSREVAEKSYSLAGIQDRKQMSA